MLRFKFDTFSNNSEVTLPATLGPIPSALAIIALSPDEIAKTISSTDKVDTGDNPKDTTHPILESQVRFIEGPNYLFDSIRTHKFFSANFEQTTIHDKKRRLVRGKIIAHRSGKFKISYYEPLNEIMFSDGEDFYRYDPELEQVNVQPLDELLSETPIGLFTLNVEEIKDNLRAEIEQEIVGQVAVAIRDQVRQQVVEEMVPIIRAEVEKELWTEFEEAMRNERAKHEPSD